MKLYHISVSGLPLFKQELELNFFAQQRVSENDKTSLLPLCPVSKYYLNPAEAVIGINSSGKTSVLKVILLAIDILNNEPISHCETRDILGNAEKVDFTICFLSDAKELCKLETVIRVQKKTSNLIYKIESETLWTKSLSSAVTKSKLIDFAGVEPYAVRNNEEAFLPDDVSIIIAYNKKNKQHIQAASLLSFTNVNILPVSQSIPSEVIQFLDPTIEYLYFDKQDQKVSIHLKFINENEIILSDPSELNRYLSSGTVKGIVTFTLAIQTLQSGGYLIIDEIENHFNREIAATLMRFFMDAEFNINGGVLFFSTHYPELLDEFDRNDSIFITRNRNGIEVSNLNDILKRNDLKKSDAYESGILEGTVPTYTAYMNLKKNIRSLL